ncbi:unnamed protein product [Boreogadus saida]
MGLSTVSHPFPTGKETPVSAGLFCFKLRHSLRCSTSLTEVKEEEEDMHLIPRDEDKMGACLREMPQESWEISDFRLGKLASEDSLAE